ncbi:MAG TPA: ATP-dependent DNA helicase [Actinomycetota bacterium]
MASKRGATLFIGAAGTGKTTALRDRAVALLGAGEPGVLLLVHNRRAARALGDAIVRALGCSTGEVRVATWHALALGLLRAGYDALGYARPPALLSAPEQFALVREMLGTEEERARWRAFPKQVRLAGFAAELHEFVLRAQDAVLSPEELEERAGRAGRPELAEAARFFRRYLDQLDQRDLVDHANAIVQATNLLERHREALAGQGDFRHLLADDYQDVTPGQERLLRALFASGGSIAVAADPEARVFGFRGSAEDAVAAFESDFAPVERVELTTPHRGEPERAAWLFDHLSGEAEAIAREALRAHAREGIGRGDIGVVVRRYGAVSRAVRRALGAAGLPYVVVGENRPLADEPALRPMLDLARAALLPEALEDLLPALLSSPLCGLDPYDVRALRREARLACTTLAGLLTEQPEGLPERLGKALAGLAGLVADVRAADQKEQRADGVFWWLWESLPAFRASVAAGDDEALDAVTAFSRAIERFSDAHPGASFADYLRTLEGVEFGPEPWRMPEERRPDAVRILTAHHAAGAEFEVVFVAGAVEGEFPDLRAARPMIDLASLVAPASPRERAARRMAEERRLFGVATSRARRRLVITASETSAQNEGLAPTPFIAHFGLAWNRPEPPAEPLTRREAEAWARRVLRTPGAPGRDEAMDLLARLPGVDPDAWWYEKDWTDPGIPLAGEDLRTSYSRLSSYDNCSLQYLYQVELGLDTSESHQMRVGTWIHDIVDRASRGDIPLTEEALLAALGEVWDPAIFDSVAVEHRRRLDSEEMLRRWLDQDGKLDTLASEVAFEFPLRGATMRGRIDRVVRLGGSMVRLIDYKTGRNAKTDAEAAEDLQLASYYLALTKVDELRTLGTPKILQLSYLGALLRSGGFLRASFDPTKVEGFAEAAEERLQSFVDGIKNEEFAPNPGADCQWCRFKVLCPVWPQGDEVPL